MKYRIREIQPVRYIVVYSRIAIKHKNLHKLISFDLSTPAPGHGVFVAMENFDLLKNNLIRCWFEFQQRCQMPFLHFKVEQIREAVRNCVIEQVKSGTKHF